MIDNSKLIEITTKKEELLKDIHENKDKYSKEELREKYIEYSRLFIMTNSIYGKLG